MKFDLQNYTQQQTQLHHNNGNNKNLTIFLDPC